MVPADAAGGYRLEVGESTVLFVTKAAGYAVPLDPLQGVSIPKSAPFDYPRF